MISWNDHLQWVKVLINYQTMTAEAEEITTTMVMVNLWVWGTHTYMWHTFFARVYKSISTCITNKSGLVITDTICSELKCETKHQFNSWAYYNHTLGGELNLVPYFNLYFSAAQNLQYNNHCTFTCTCCTYNVQLNMFSYMYSQS